MFSGQCNFSFICMVYVWCGNVPSPSHAFCGLTVVSGQAFWLSAVVVGLPIIVISGLIGYCRFCCIFGRRKGVRSSFARGGNAVIGGGGGPVPDWLGVFYALTTFASVIYLALMFLVDQ